MRLSGLTAITLCCLSLHARANAQETSDASAASHPAFVLGGYVEAFYQLNFNFPVNGITNFRGFDNRHNSFTLSNVALDTQWDSASLLGRLTLQVGHTPSTYYLGEPSSPGAAGANASNTELWKYIQQAYVGYLFGVGGGLAVTAGIFLSPIGYESMAVHDNWNWSRSNLFFGLPFYHTGVRAAYSFTEEWTLTLAAYNGWSSVVDNNTEKSVSAQLTYTQPQLAISIVYFGGVERPRGAPEGRAWRQLLDANVTWQATSWLALAAYADAGFEPNHFGTSHWQAAALYARVRLLAPLFIAARVDGFREHVAHNQAGEAAPIFWPASWVSSQTLTLDYRPHERVTFRLEYRHDQAAANMYFDKHARTAGSDAAYVPDAKAQDTVTLGASAWF